MIYVGKAKDLKKRLTSYFRKNLPSVSVKIRCTATVLDLA
ncbi:excinuclease ABC subunit C [Vibrio cholerae]|nr:excinuclease ABC subunit C [Vibrio cholerae]